MGRECLGFAVQVCLTLQGKGRVEHEGDPLHEGGLLSNQAHSAQQGPSRMQCHLSLYQSTYVSAFICQPMNQPSTVNP